MTSNFKCIVGESRRITIELRQIVPHLKYEISPIDNLSNRALSTFTFLLRESEVLPGYNFAVYGDDSSVYLEFDSHHNCPQQLEYSLEWYGDDEGESSTKHTATLTLRLL